MKGLPAELLYLLILVGIFLVQYLMKRLASRRQRRASQEPPVPQSADTSPSNLAEFGQAIPLVRSWPRAESPSRAEELTASRPRPRRRFTRQALLGTRPDVQNAIVLAAIIGPCRALEPPGDAGVPTLGCARRHARPVD